MILCDLCGKQQKLGDLFNLLKLQWINLVAKQGWDYAEYQLCSNCVKKLNEHIKRQVKKRGNPDADNADTKT